MCFMKVHPFHSVGGPTYGSLSWNLTSEGSGINMFGATHGSAAEKASVSDAIFLEGWIG